MCRVRGWVEGCPASCWLLSCSVGKGKGVQCLCDFGEQFSSFFALSGPQNPSLNAAGEGAALLLDLKRIIGAEMKQGDEIEEEENT